MQGAEFQYPEYPPQSTTEMKAACIGFRGTFWYHLGFSAHPMDATAETQHFFAELYFDRQYLELAVETCIILGEISVIFYSVDAPNDNDCNPMSSGQPGGGGGGGVVGILGGG
uniref:DUF3615 domain-containing protein n=1 Tax=Aegilops tauschii TaxID=37682 RepID=N1QUR9_AEGTA